jgi:hypothetical protein
MKDKHVYCLDGGSVKDAQDWRGCPDGVRYDKTCSACGLPIVKQRHIKLSEVGKADKYYHADCIYFESMIGTDGKEISQEVNDLLKEQP